MGTRWQMAAFLRPLAYVAVGAVGTLVIQRLMDNTKGRQQTSKDEESHEDHLEAVEEMVFLLSAKAQKKWDELDADKNGKLEGEELLELAAWVYNSFHPLKKATQDQKLEIRTKILQRHDANRDGAIDKEEFVEYFEEKCQQMTLFHKQREARKKEERLKVKEANEAARRAEALAKQQAEATQQAAAVEARQQAENLSRVLVASAVGAPETEVIHKQGALGLGANAVSPEQRLYLRMIFTTIDSDSSGAVDLGEMCTEMVQGAGASQMLAKMFHAMDATDSKDGKVELGEFMAYWESAVGVLGWANVQTALMDMISQMLGKERRSSLNYAVDNAAVMEELRQRSMTRADTMFRDIDTDGNEVLTKNEILDWAMENPELAKQFIPCLDSGNDMAFQTSLYQWEAIRDKSVLEGLEYDEFKDAYCNAMEMALNAAEDALEVAFLCNRA